MINIFKCFYFFLNSKKIMKCIEKEIDLSSSSNSRCSSSIKLIFDPSLLKIITVKESCDVSKSKTPNFATLCSNAADRRFREISSTPDGRESRYRFRGTQKRHSTVTRTRTTLILSCLTLTRLTGEKKYEQTNDNYSTTMSMATAKRKYGSESRGSRRRTRGRARSRTQSSSARVATGPVRFESSAARSRTPTPNRHPQPFGI